MTNPFGNLNTQGMEAAKDVLGGGFEPLPSGVYNGKVKAAYAGKSDSGAQSMTIVLALENGREYRETIYVTSGTAKGGKNTYVDKEGKTQGLPGFITVNDLAMMTTGKELNDQTFEQKVQKIWDKDAKQELPQNVLMAVDMLDRDVCVAILETIEPKQVKGNAPGEYVDDPNGGTRSVNSIAKVFHPVSGHTVSELTHDMTKHGLSAKDVIEQHKGTFRDEWAAKNDGKPKVKRSNAAAGTAGVPGQKPAQAGAQGGAPKKSLFE